MDASFDPIETVPGKNAFGLDTLRRSYRTTLSAEDAIAACPDLGTADEVFDKMFLTSATTPEPAGNATRVDLVYTGAIKTVSGDPVLPASKSEDDDSVQSVSSKRTSSGTILTDPVTIQYYAPSKVLTYVSFGGPGAQVAADPDEDPRVISYSVGDTAFSIGVVIQEVIDLLFMPQIVHTPRSTEIVPGQYWLNVSRKTKTLSPWIFDVTPGAYVLLASPGNGYTIGDTLTITVGGESATIVVDQVFGAFGGSGLLTWHVTANTFTAAHNLIAATGGTGTGAKFNVIIIT